MNFWHCEILIKPRYEELEGVDIRIPLRDNTSLPYLDSRH